MDVDTPSQSDKALSSATDDVQDGRSSSPSLSHEPQADQLSKPYPPSEASVPKEAQNLFDKVPASVDKMTDVEHHGMPQASFQKSSPSPAEVYDTSDKDGLDFESEILADVNGALKPLTDRLHSEHIERAMLEEAVLPYQQKLVAALQELGDLRKQLEAQPNSNSEEVNKLRSELSFLTSKMNELSETKIELEMRLVKRDHLIAKEAAELARLRTETKVIPDLRAELLDVLERREFAENKLAEVETTYAARTRAAEEGVRSLNAKVVELTTQLTKKQCEFDALDASLYVKINDTKNRACQAESEAERLRKENLELQETSKKLENDLEDARASSEELNKSFEGEIAEMNKILELTKQRAGKAEAHARDLVEELKQERELSMKREKRRMEKKSLIPHAETLLSDVENALQAKWAALEAQKNEMERARKSEMSVLAAQEKLRKEKIDAQFLAEQQRKECVRLNRQVDQQANEIERLKRLLEHSHDFPPSPTNANMMPRRSTGLGAPSPVAWRNSTERQTPDEMMDIGPESAIPTHYFPSPSDRLPDDFQSSVRQLSAIREDHKNLLESLRHDRISFG